MTYPSAEAAFQAAKTLDTREKRKFTNYTAAESKKEGRRLRIRDDWEEVKLTIMEDILRKKFVGELAQKLIDTYPFELIEENNWRDTFWGTCGGRGQNHLGKILMKIRKELIH